MLNNLVFVEQQPMTGRVVSIEPGVTIGREGCDVVLPDPEVSRLHARLCAIDDDPAIEDLGSTNGTFVNDHQVGGPTRVHVGDVVRLGNTVWHVQAPGAPTRVA